MSFSKYVEEKLVTEMSYKMRGEHPEADEFIDYVESEFKNHFPNGYFYGKVYNGLGSPVLSCSFGLIGGDKDVSNGIRENDPMYHTFLIHSKGDFTVDTLEFSSLQSGLSIEPPKDSFYAMGRVKTKLTNAKKGSLDKYKKKMKTFFGKLATIVKDNQDNIYRVDTIDTKYFKIK